VLNGTFLIGVLVNSNARGVLRDPGLPARLERALAGAGQSRRTNRPDEVADAVADLSRAGARVLVVCGGDGAAMLAATAMARSGRTDLPLAVLPGGTMNTLCRNLGIRGRPEAVLARVRSALEAGPLPVRLQPTVRVDGHVGFMFGAGLVGNFFEVYYASPRRGRAYAAAQVVRIMAGGLFGSKFSRRIVRPVTADVEVDGTTLPWRSFTVFAAGTVENVGVGLRVLHRAAERADAFHFLASGLTVGEIAPQATRIFRGKALTGERHHDGLAENAHIRFERPAPYVLDGEPFEAQSVRLTAGPPIPLVVL
jgi:undecaprenyl-diphosphatase